MRILLFLFLLASFTTATAQTDHEAIVQTLNYYLDGGTNNDFATLKKAFHESATMQFIDGEGNHQSVNAIAFFEGGMKPGPKQDRQTRITSIEVNGNAASARLEIDYPTFRFVDFMNLLKIDGEWKVVSKIFFRENRT